MRFFLFSLFAGSLLLLPACTFQTSGSSPTEVPPGAPSPIPDSPPVTAPYQAVEKAKPAPASPPPAPEFALDPAPAPPTEQSSLPPAEPPSTKSSSAGGVFHSVARVLRGAVEGSDNETGEDAEVSVVGSIGRALSKGFQEAAAGEHTSEN